MSTIGDSRAAVLAGLEAGGIRTATTGKMSAPAVLVEPGDPWSTPVRLPGRLIRWQLTAVAGRADSEGSFAELAELVDSVDAALRTVAGCRLPTWAKARDALLGGVPYAAAVATIEYATGG